VEKAASWTGTDQLWRRRGHWAPAFGALLPASDFSAEPCCSPR
jgi:hypothetical protein